MSLFARNALISLLITVLLIGTVAYTVNYLNRSRVAQLNDIEDQLSLDTLSIETQFSLLASAPCDTIASSTLLSSALTDLDNRLSYTEGQLESDNPQVIQLKKRYSLLEIRDYLINKELAATCHTKPITVLYFYSNAGDCDDCAKAGHALSYLRETYPSLRVYSFDYNLDLGALKTLIAVNKVKPTLPAFVIADKHYYGFTSFEELAAQFPKGALATTTATTTH